jgi:5-(carboxyamino)imidazole ribonucleotide mutase
MTGSPSDLPVVVQARDVLDELGISNDLRVLSAHRTPHDAVAYVEAAEQAGVEVFIACAGMSAHLAGVVAAHTTRPVIGVPLKSTALDGMDALLSTVMMPPGIPVATVAIDGAKNAGFLPRASWPVVAPRSASASWSSWPRARSATTPPCRALPRRATSWASAPPRRRSSPR